MSVVKSAQSSTITGSTSSGSITASITPNSGDTAMLFTISLLLNAALTSYGTLSATANGVSMTLLAEGPTGASGVSTLVFGLVSPTAVTQNVVFSWTTLTNSLAYIAAVETFSGSLTNISTAFTGWGTTSTTASSISIGISSAPGDLVVGVFSSSIVATPGIGSGGTSFYALSSNGFGAASAYWSGASGTVTVSFSNSSSGNLALSAGNVVAAAAPIAETNINQIGQFVPPTIKRNYALLFGENNDLQPSTPLAETNINVVWRYSPPAIWRVRALLFEGANDIQPTAPIAETNVNFVGRYGLSTIVRNWSLLFNSANDPPPTPLPATGPSNIIRTRVGQPAGWAGG